MSDKTTRVVPDDEELSVHLMEEKFNEGAIWHGSYCFNIGWPEELEISGRNLIRLLDRLRDKHHSALEEVKRALDSHNVPNPEGLSQADRIHLLVGRKSR